MHKRTIGFWIIEIVGIFILIILLLGQMMSFINYEFTVSIGLQESADIVGDIGVAVNKAFGVGDTLIYLPLLVLGLIGIWLRKTWGIFTMIGALGITAYWPVVCMFILIFSRGIPGFNFNSYLSYTIILSLVTAYGIWGIYYIYVRRNSMTGTKNI